MVVSHQNIGDNLCKGKIPFAKHNLEIQLKSGTSEQQREGLCGDSQQRIFELWLD